MNRKWIVGMVIVFCLAVAGSVAAQGSGPLAPQGVAVTTKFTYQGQINRNGALFTGTCDMRFKLWDAGTAGMQLGTYTPPTSVTVTDGVFAVEVDFGNQFTGEARWLQTEAKCADDIGYTALPRVALTAAPYAIGLLPGAVISGTGSLGVMINTPNGNALAAYGKSNGYATIYGSDGSSGGGYGVYGVSTTGVGVLGSSQTWHGVRGESRDNVGVLGKSTHFDGVWGETDADNASGVVGWGKDPCPNPNLCSVLVKRNATGVYGEALASGSGVEGRSALGVGVAGFKSGYVANDISSYNFSTPAALFGGPNGVIGFTKSSGNGVSGVATTAAGTGVYGYNFAGGYAAQFYGKAAASVLEIRGGADLAERFNVSGDKAEPGTLMVIDVNNPGHLTISRSAYDTKVAGIVSGAGDVKPGLTLRQEGVMEGNTEVAIAGRVYVKAIGSNGSIEPGDLLTTSDRPGYAMKATDPDRSHGAIIGKAMTGLKDGTGLVLVLVNLQ